MSMHIYNKHISLLVVGVLLHIQLGVAMYPVQNRESLSTRKLHAWLFYYSIAEILEPLHDSAHNHKLLYIYSLRSLL